MYVLYKMWVIIAGMWPAACCQCSIEFKRHVTHLWRAIMKYNQQSRKEWADKLSWKKIRSIFYFSLAFTKNEMTAQWLAFSGSAWRYGKLELITSIWSKMCVTEYVQNQNRLLFFGIALRIHVFSNWFMNRITGIHSFLIPAFIARENVISMNAIL